MSISAQPRVTSQNKALYESLLELTGRYLDCVSAAPAGDITFGYDVRQEAPGFLKLDIGFEILVVGCDARHGPVGRFLSVVEKAHYVASISAQTPMFSFVPIVFFGERAPHLFYIESLRGFARVSPFFIEAAHEFLARRILPAYLGTDPVVIRRYLRTLQAGEDPKGILAREPLIREAIASAPEETRAEMVRQIADDLEFRLDSAP